MDFAKRQQWMATLAKAPLPSLEMLFAKVGDLPEYGFLRSPETGLTMVRGRAGGVGEVFNLGEMTLTRCVVQLFVEEKENEAGPIAGFGYVGGRSHRHAELAALGDGLLQHEGWHSQIFREVIEPLRAIALAEKEQRQQQTAATKVDFFTMLRGE
ncbi:MAG: phosphonate C-P lyase system protein PhnG [Cyanobacteria bacterium J06649_4]